MLLKISYCPYIDRVIPVWQVPSKQDTRQHWALHMRYPDQWPNTETEVCSDFLLDSYSYSFYHSSAFTSVMC